MNTKLFFIILLLLAGVAIFGSAGKSKPSTSATVSSNPQSGEQESGFLPQIKTMGAVEVEISPISIKSGENTVFELSMNTHSVELSYDYIQIATLTDESGNDYKPTEWTGGNSGHHLSGELIFPTLSSTPKQLTLTLEGVDNETEDFRWKL